MKYFAGIFFVFLFTLFAGMAVIMPFTDLASKSPAQAIGGIIISVPMTVFCGLGAYYCLRYGKYFTKEFRVDSESMEIFDSGVRESIHRWEDLDSMVYRKWLTVFELCFNNPKSTIVLMNNGQRKTDEFYELEKILLELDVPKKVSQI